MSVRAASAIRQKTHRSVSARRRCASLFLRSAGRPHASAHFRRSHGLAARRAHPHLGLGRPRRKKSPSLSPAPKPPPPPTRSASGTLNCRPRTPAALSRLPSRAPLRSASPTFSSAKSGSPPASPTWSSRCTMPPTAPKPPRTPIFPTYALHRPQKNRRRFAKRYAPRRMANLHAGNRQGLFRRRLFFRRRPPEKTRRPRRHHPQRVVRLRRRRVDLARRAPQPTDPRLDSPQMGCRARRREIFRRRARPLSNRLRRLRTPPRKTRRQRHHQCRSSHTPAHAAFRFQRRLCPRHRRRHIQLRLGGRSAYLVRTHLARSRRRKTSRSAPKASSTAPTPPFSISVIAPADTPINLSAYEGVNSGRAATARFNFKACSPPSTIGTTTPEQSSPVTREWKPYIVRFADLKQDGWGVVEPFTPAELSGFRLLSMTPQGQPDRPPVRNV